jgi:4-amino-4-deoxy-L-arabinose transferase-like glycosyltransferase
MGTGVMLEVSAFAIALLSIYCLFKWSESQHVVWLWISGSVMGIALGIKLTAILMVPAILLEIVLATRKHQAACLKRALIPGAQWIGAAVRDRGSERCRGRYGVSA